MPPTPSSPSAPWSGPLYMAAAAVTMALVGVTIKWATHDLPPTVVVFFRNFFGLVTLLPWLAAPGGISLRTAVPHLHLTRCLLGIGAMFSYFYAISQLPLAHAVTLNFTSPLFIPFIARAWLGERLSTRVIAAAVIGFAGVALLKQPGAAGFSAAAAVALLSALFASASLVNVRRLTATEPTGRIVAWFALGSTVAAALPLAWTWQTPAPGQWLPLFLTGALATLSQFLLSRGYARTPAAAAAVFHYLTVPTAAFLGWLFWDERVSALAFAGAALVCAAGITASWPDRTRAAAGPAPDGDAAPSTTTIGRSDSSPSR